MAPCEISAAERAWLQSAIADWAVVTREILPSAARTLPRMVVFDSSCVWHLADPTHEPPTPEPGALRGAGRRSSQRASQRASALRYDGRAVTVWTSRHSGWVPLPSGDSVPARLIASARASSNGQPPYFVLALPSVFRQDSANAADPQLDLFLRSVMSHEIVHTTQLRDLVTELTALGRRLTLPGGINDDMVQTRFEGDSAFAREVAEERALLFAAAAEPDEARARALARQAVAVLRARRARVYVDSLAAYSRLEDLFLTMEGSAEWVRYDLHRRRGDLGSHVALLNFLRGPKPYWSQDEGLALFLVIDRFVADWKSALLTPSMPSPTDALAQALRNLQVLPPDLADDSLLAVMGGFTRALGVRCVHCHAARNGVRPAADEYASDENPTKAIARAMLRMVEDINGRHLPSARLVGATPERVTCATCHRGLARPRPLESVLRSAYQKEGLAETERLYRRLRDQYFGSDAYDFSDVTLPSVADLIGATPAQRADALALMRLNLEFHPQSWFTYQQMGQLYLLDADTVRARDAFARGLAINPTRAFLRQLQASITP